MLDYINQNLFIHNHMTNFFRQSFAKKAIMFAFLVGIISPSAMAYVDGGYPAGTTSLVAAIAPIVQNLNVSTSTNSASISFSLNTAATATVWVKDSSDTIVRTIAFDNNLLGDTVYTYNWNGLNNNESPVSSGTYKAQVVVYNTVSSDIKDAIFSYTAGSTVNAPVVSVSASPTSFDPTLGQSTTISYGLNYPADLRVEVKSGGSTIRTLRAHSLQIPGSFSIPWDGRNDAGTIMSLNSYTIEVYASNAGGNDTKSTLVNIISNNNNVTAPNITNLYASPNPFNPNSESTRIYFNLDKQASVTVSILDGTNTIRTLTSTNTLSAGTYSYDWNGRHADGYMVSDKYYTARVLASNGAGNDAENTSVQVRTTGGGNNGYENDWPSTDENLVRNLMVNPEVFNPRNGDRSTVQFQLARNSKINVQVLDGTTVVKTLRTADNQTSGDYSYTWDGRNTAGNLMPDRLYVFRVMANDGNNTDTDRGYVEVDTDGILIGFPDNARCAGFRDVSINSPFCKAIELMSKKKIFEGYSDGTFRPYERINRAETAKVVVLALDYDIETNGYFGRQYNDTIANAWYAPYLEVAKRNNIATGYPDGSFRPASTINRVELLRIFLEANNLSLSSCSPQPFDDTPLGKDTDWYMKYACYAKYNGLMNGDYSSKLYPAEAMTRGDVADLFYDFEVKGLFNSNNNYYNNGYYYNDTRSCLEYDRYNDCIRYSADTRYNNNNSTDGYYVYRDGRYVWTAY